MNCAACHCRPGRKSFTGAFARQWSHSESSFRSAAPQTLEARLLCPAARNSSHSPYTGGMQTLPFFEVRHRSIAERAGGLARGIQATDAAADETATIENARRYIQRMNDGGWFRAIDPADIRAACLIRERLAYASSLADTMFAMQG